MKDVVLDSDAYNEIDDQFAIAYLLKNDRYLNTRAIYAAPFSNIIAATPQEGMGKSYDEILKLLKLCDREVPVFRGSCNYLVDERTAVDSPAARDLVFRALQYSKDNPLYVVAIGAITNIASALLLEPKIAENIVIIWLGGHAHHWHDTVEFNMKQDIAAARVVMGSSASFVQLPCRGVVSEFSVSKPDLVEYFYDRNLLSDYLAKNTVKHMAERRKVGPIWSKPLWDVTAVAWLMNDGDKYMKAYDLLVRLPEYDGRYGPEQNKLIKYVYSINRDLLLTDLVRVLTE